MEAAIALPPSAERAAATRSMQKVATPGQKACEDVTNFLNQPLSQSLKVIAAIRTDIAAGEKGHFVVILMRGDHDLNEVKTQKIIGEFRFASESEIIHHLGCPAGYLGPIGLEKREDIALYADHAVTVMSDFICGANEKDMYFTGVNWERDLPLPENIADFRNVVEGDPSPDGKGTLAIQRGIEVGHVFQLGTRYSEDMNASYLDENGKPQLMQMGCYGIGVTRIVGAAIEQNNDDKGIIWPTSIAPFEVVLCPLGYDRSEAVKKTADELYESLKQSGIDVIMDDRGERPGVMFSDWELIGVPHRIVIGDRGLKDGKLEYQGRRDTEATAIPVGDMAQFVIAKVAAEK